MPGRAGSAAETVVTGGGQPTAIIVGDLDLLRPFIGSGVPTIMFLGENHRALRFSRHVRAWRHLPDPERNPAEAFAALREFAGRSPAKPVLIYADDAMLALLRARRREFEEMFLFLAPPDPVLDSCTDKRAFALRARDLGLPIPKSGFGDDQDIRLFARRNGFPVILKPEGHIGWRRSEAVALTGGGRSKVLTARSSEELERVLPAMRRFSPNFIVQEFVPGGENQIFSYHAFVGREGDPIASFVGRKIRTDPSVGGESSYIEMVRDDEIRRLGEDAVRRFGIVGPVKIDVKRHPETGKDLILEINLRFSLWHHLGAANGVNLPLTAYRRLTGGAAPIADLRTKFRWLDFRADVRAFWRDYRPQGVWTLPTYARSLLRPKVYRNFAWDDPMPAVAAIVQALSRKIARLIRGLSARALSEGRRRSLEE